MNKLAAYELLLEGHPLWNKKEASKPISPAMKANIAKQIAASLKGGRARTVPGMFGNPPKIPKISQK